MRIQLLDPKWAEEKKRFQEKQKESNLVSGDAIATNISRLVGEAATDAPAPQAGPSLPPPSRPGPGPGPAPGGRPRNDLMGLPPPKRARMNLPPPATGVGPPSGGRPGGFSRPPPPSGGGMRLPPPRMPPRPPGMQSSQPFDTIGNASARGGTGGPGYPSRPPPGPTAAEKRELVPADEFAASLNSPEVTLEIQIPNDPTQATWNFHGQTVSVQVNVKSTIKTVKEQLRGQLNGIPVTKLQLKHNLLGFPKDASTLAELNLGPLVNLEMVPRKRSRRK